MRHKVPGRSPVFRQKSSYLLPGSLNRFPTSLLFPLALLAVLVAFFPGAKLHAQTGSVTGTVVDPSGAAIPGAHVQIVNQSTGSTTRDATTDPGGTFRALNVPPATYRIKISATGMQDLSRDGVILDQDQTLGLGQVPMSLG